MAYLLDTNILLRDTNSTDIQHLATKNALALLHRRNEILHITAQVIIEYRCAVTRPIAVNGLGLSAHAAELEIERFKKLFSFLPDTPDIFTAWETLVSTTLTIGKPVHDARLVAVCHVHGITNLLTFNTSHFKRYDNIGPGLSISSPLDIR